MAAIWRAYHRLLNAHPFKTQVTTTGVIMFVADIIAQQGVQRRGWKQHDFSRSVRQSLLGFVFVGPTLTVWYRLVDGLFKGTPQIALLKKVAADQLVFAPTFIASFFVMNGLFMSASAEDIKNRLSKNYVAALLTNYKIWPAVQMFNFYIVPLYYRVLVAQTVAVFWNTYLIWKVTDEVETTKEIVVNDV